MNNTPDSPAKTPDDRTHQGGNYWTLFTPGIWKVLHAVLHPSFPSGHATQGMLMALCAEAVMPTQKLKDAWRPLLQTLAGRIARNREIAGLHYESDTRGGLELARKTFDRLATCALLIGIHDDLKNIHVDGVLDEASREWL